MGRERAKTRATYILTKHEITTGSVLLGKVIHVHDYNSIGRTLVFSWKGKMIADYVTPRHWIDQSPKHRTFIVTPEMPLAPSVIRGMVRA